MPLHTLLGLILCNAIWALNPMMGKIAFRDFSPLQTSWLRYFSALCTGIIVILAIRILTPVSKRQKSISFARSDFGWLALLGLITFCFLPYLQYMGLSQTSSTANSLIVAIEPLCAALLARIFLRELFSRKQVLLFAIALVGFLLLSNIRPVDFYASLHEFSMGNLILLASMPLESTYSIVSRKLAGRISPEFIFALAGLAGMAIYSVLIFSLDTKWPKFSEIHSSSILAILWIGPLSTALGYIYWSHVLKTIPVAAVSITLFAQPIIGAISGIFYIGEKFNLWQFLGGFLILLSLLFETKIKNRSQR